MRAGGCDLLEPDSESESELELESESDSLEDEHVTDRFFFRLSDFSFGVDVSFRLLLAFVLPLTVMELLPLSRCWYFFIDFAGDWVLVSLSSELESELESVLDGLSDPVDSDSDSDLDLELEPELESGSECSELELDSFGVLLSGFP